MIDHLIKLVRACFSQIPDHRRSSGNTTYKLVRRALERVYGIEVVPGDTALGEGLDGVLPAHLQDCFGTPLEELRHQGVSQKRLVLGEYLTVSIDGTGHYCSGTHSCPHCLVKKHRGGKESFYHQLLAAVQVHPEQSAVLPLAGEAIVNGDGAKKNDCALNAGKRLIPQLRRTMPHGKLLGVLDALYANGPLIKLLKKHRISFLITIKEGNYIRVQVERLREQGKLEAQTWSEGPKKTGTAQFANGLNLNGTHQDIPVNYLEYTETDNETGQVLSLGMICPSHACGKWRT